MVAPATRAGGRGSPPHSTAPFLLLRAAHLRFYGFDAELALSCLSRGTQDIDRNSSTPTAKPPVLSVGGSLELQQQQQQQQQRPAGGAALGAGACNPGSRRGKPPLAPPPALSARCQVHPAVLQDLGSCPGDPVLVLTLAEGWASNSPHRAALATSGASASPVDSESPATVVGGVHSVVHQGGVEACHQDTEGLALEPWGSVEQLRHDQTLEQRQPRDEQPPEAENDRQRTAFLSEAAASLRCFLCTVWTNPDLAPGETAVDGRVALPLPPTTTAAAAAAGPATVQPRHDQPETTPPAPEQPSPRSPPLPDSATLAPSIATRPPKPSTNTDLVGVSLITRFLIAAIEGHVSASAGSGEGHGDSVVGVVPVHALCGGFGRGVNAPPVAGRVSAQMIGCSGGANGAPELAEGSSEGESESPIGLEQQQQPQQRQGYLPPEYTSLVKRSLRHLLVCDGCEVVVPSCPDNSGTTMEGRSGGGGGSSGGGGGGGGGGRDQQQSPQDGTALVRIDTASFCVDDDDDGGALSAVVGGGTCVIGPESLVLVEDKGETSGGTTGSRVVASLPRGGAKDGGAGGGDARAAHRGNVGCIENNQAWVARSTAYPRTTLLLTANRFGLSMPYVLSSPLRFAAARHRTGGRRRRGRRFEGEDDADGGAGGADAAAHDRDDDAQPGRWWSR